MKTSDGGSPERATLNPYQAMREVAPGIHCVDGWWRRSPMGRRMTVADVGANRLAVHSAIRTNEEDTARLEALGRVAYVIAPNPMHASETPWYAERYPDAKVLTPERCRRRLERRVRVDATVEDWPEELAGTLEALPVGGLRFGESAYLHVASRTLLLTDLAMNYGPDHFSGVGRFVMKLNGIVDRFGPSRLLRFAFIANREQLAGSVRRILEWDFDRVIVSHGRILESGGKARIAESFRFLLEVRD